jgi:hypothetical protein
MILWSWCVADLSEAVCVKDERCFLREDRNGKPIPATQNDLRKLLGLAPGLKTVGRCSNSSFLPETSVSTRLLYSRLALFVGKDGSCFPPVETHRRARGAR